ncbi:MAG TPA: glutaredoxin 3 [Steroidobacteraceae bacterium]|nr:glutaredoxin 3 [Steroidobacteraceae bacterium]
MGLPKVLLYVTDWCPYCARARSLLASKGVAFEEIDIEAVEGARSEMEARSGRSSVPQIFIGDQHVGGCDELQALDEAGRLDPLLK